MEPDRAIALLLGATLALLGLAVAGPLRAGARLPGPAYASRRLERRSQRLLGLAMALAGATGGAIGAVWGVLRGAAVMGYGALAALALVVLYTRREAALEDIREPPPPGAPETLEPPRWGRLAGLALAVSSVLELAGSGMLAPLVGAWAALTASILGASGLLLAALVWWAPETLVEPGEGWTRLAAGTAFLAVACAGLGLLFIGLAAP